MWEVSFSDMSSVLGTLETRSKELKVHVGKSCRQATRVQRHRLVGGGGGAYSEQYSFLKG